MFNSVALDVVIGLIFIYLLYSLLGTIIGEIFTTYLGLRAKNLKKAISRMLEDEYNKRIPENKEMSKNGKEENREENKMIIADNFYNHPMIKYLASGKKYSKPSYISADTFSRTLISLLKKNSDGKSELDKIIKTLSTPIGINGIKYNETETGQMIQSFLDEAQNDIQKFRLLLEQWFDDTMNRASGWYKRNTQLMLLGIGFIIAVLFNASTLYIVDKLARDDESREQMVQLATAYVENNPLEIGATQGIDSSNIQDFNEKLDSLLQIKRELETDIREAGNILGPGWTLPDSLTIINRVKPITDLPEKRLIFLRKKSNQYLYASVPIDLDYDITRKTLFDKDGSLKKRIEIKPGSMNLSKWPYIIRFFIKHLPGYFITALAISLGAPFWFDLLNKIVRIRNSLQQPAKQQHSNKPGEGERIPV